MKLFLVLIFLCLLVVTGVQAKPLRIVTWNVYAGTIEGIENRALSDFMKAGKELKPDILIIQEINSYASAQRIAELMNIKSAHIAISNFNRDIGAFYQGHEVAVISRIPIKSLTEYDTGIDEFGAVTISPSGNIDYGRGVREIKLVTPTSIISNPISLRGQRGFLRVELKNDIVIYPVHLKSNLLGYCFTASDAAKAVVSLRRKINKVAGSEPDVKLLESMISRLKKYGDADTTIKRSAINSDVQRNAKLREQVMAAIGLLAKKDVANKKTPLVAGDFNTSDEEPCKSGSRLDQDAKVDFTCASRKVPNTCGGMDGFDDTHALLSRGIISGLKMRSLTNGIGRTHLSADENKYADVPIDHIYVDGPRKMKFSKAIKLGIPQYDNRNRPRVFGSDHHPVLTIMVQ